MKGTKMTLPAIVTLFLATAGFQALAQNPDYAEQVQIKKQRQQMLQSTLRDQVQVAKNGQNNANGMQTQKGKQTEKGKSRVLVMVLGTKITDPKTELVMGPTLATGRGHRMERDHSTDRGVAAIAAAATDVVVDATSC